ncbi:alpha/beta hydrolase [Aspergillus chevalieri]|uniref:Alpha/beta hydrolase fold-3 domain-containing protein n=1 Tax=Aspergillus chevalieri TaxID=182096 RepID=A0A7R7VVC8_ASPCH|nr:uncharacterized protein ACHE_70284A [Aspergillus chevalieri]BCR91441.1 hypothetical protein ACHE_70284A [Aspergillus chevalieri]
MPLQYDPEFAELAAPVLQLVSQAERPAIHDIDTRRANLDAFSSQATATAQIPNDVEQIVHYARTADNHDVPMLHFRRKNTLPSGPGPAIVHMHGGGFIALSAAIGTPSLSRFVSETGVQILSIDYRLAPENIFPKPLDDCWTALTWIHGHAHELSIDNSRIAVMGESAGGSLAAGLTLLARDRGLSPPLAKQILVYPMLDDRTRTNPFGDLAFWSAEDNVTGWTAYLGASAAAKSVSPYAAPARVNSVQGLPPLYLDCGQIDVFALEDVRYVLRFMEANIPAELHVYEGLPHGFEGFAPTSGAVKQAFANRARAIISF